MLLTRLPYLQAVQAAVQAALAQARATVERSDQSRVHPR